MDSVIVACAQYLPFVIAVALAFVWLRAGKSVKWSLAVRGAIACLLAIVLIKVAAAIHTDPRPFVLDPSVTPLFPHGPDNGFPSDHTTMSFTFALLVLAYRRTLGYLLLVLAALVAWARVASQVHHLQDVLAGALIALVAVGIAVWVEPRVTALRQRRQPSVEGRG